MWNIKRGVLTSRNCPYVSTSQSDKPQTTHRNIWSIVFTCASVDERVVIDISARPGDGKTFTAPVDIVITQHGELVHVIDFVIITTIVIMFSDEKSVDRAVNRTLVRVYVAAYAPPSRITTMRHRARIIIRIKNATKVRVVYRVVFEYVYDTTLLYLRQYMYIYIYLYVRGYYSGILYHLRTRILYRCNVLLRCLI